MRSMMQLIYSATNDVKNLIERGILPSPRILTDEPDSGEWIPAGTILHVPSGSPSEKKYRALLRRLLEREQAARKKQKEERNAGVNK